MKKIKHYFFVILIFGTAFNTKGQDIDSNLIEKYLLDFSVPDMPAFKALNIDPSNILRPSDVKKFAVMVSPFYSNQKGVIPKNFALEFAPWKLASSKWTLNDYSTNCWLRFKYRSSFSIGAIQDSQTFASRLSIGYRVSILSRKADIYRAKDVRDQVKNLPNILAAYTVLTNDWVVTVVNPPVVDRPTYYQNHMDDFLEFLKTIKKYLKDHPGNDAIQSHYDALMGLKPDNISDNAYASVLESVGKNIDDFIEQYKKNNWNASRTDLAVAFVAMSSDSLLSNSQFSSLSIWGTQSIAIGKGSQLLIGLNVQAPRSEIRDSARVNLSANVRYYLGTEDFRAFVESQFKYQKFEQPEKKLLINLGAEFRLGENYWMVASTGVDNYLSETNPFNKLVANLDIRYCFNRPKK